MRTTKRYGTTKKSTINNVPIIRPMVASLPINDYEYGNGFLPTGDTVVLPSNDYNYYQTVWDRPLFGYDSDSSGYSDESYNSAYSNENDSSSDYNDNTRSPIQPGRLTQKTTTVAIRGRRVVRRRPTRLRRNRNRNRNRLVKRVIRRVNSNRQTTNNG